MLIFVPLHHTMDALLISNVSVQQCESKHSEIIIMDIFTHCNKMMTTSGYNMPRHHS